jgi:hypothetical protein
VPRRRGRRRRRSAAHFPRSLGHPATSRQRRQRGSFPRRLALGLAAPPRLQRALRPRVRRGRKRRLSRRWKKPRGGPVAGAAWRMPAAFFAAAAAGAPAQRRARAGVR